jgi:hypothetical protein
VRAEIVWQSLGCLSIIDKEMKEPEWILMFSLRISKTDERLERRRGYPFPPQGTAGSFYEF